MKRMVIREFSFPAGPANVPYSIVLCLVQPDPDKQEYEYVTWLRDDNNKSYGQGHYYSVAEYRNENISAYQMALCDYFKRVTNELRSVHYGPFHEQTYEVAEVISKDVHTNTTSIHD